MYCPNCSVEAPAEQKFCRACGMELRAVAELINAQVGIDRPENSTDHAFLPRHRAIMIWGFILTFGSAGAGAALKILGKDNIQPAGEFTPYINVILPLLALLGLGVMSYPFLQMIFPRRSAKPETSFRSPRTSKVSPDLLTEEPSSVTEQTTEMLDASEARSGVQEASPKAGKSVVS